MKLDKLKFAKLVQFISMSLNCDLSHQTIQELDAMIDIPAPIPYYNQSVSVEKVDELLNCLFNPPPSGGIIPAIKAYRALTNASLLEAKTAVEKYMVVKKSNLDADNFGIRNFK